jgi:hypothetical protein
VFAYDPGPQSHVEAVPVVMGGLTALGSDPRAMSWGAFQE